MNETLKQIIEKAGWTDWTEDDNWIHPSMERGYFWTGDFEKLAELIVKECASVCYQHSFNAGDQETVLGQAYTECGDDIKRLFGVK